METACDGIASRFLVEAPGIIGLVAVDATKHSNVILSECYPFDH
jgi:hypothetical protein